MKDHNQPPANTFPQVAPPAGGLISTCVVLAQHSRPGYGAGMEAQSEHAIGRTLPQRAASRAARDPSCATSTLLAVLCRRYISVPPSTYHPSMVYTCPEVCTIANTLLLIT